MDDKILKLLEEKLGEAFSEEVKTKLKESFDNAVNERVLNITAKADDYKKKLDEELETEKEKLATTYEEKYTVLKESIAKFLDNTSNELFEENKVNYENTAILIISLNK